MNSSNESRTRHAGFLILLAALGAAFLSSCASTTDRPPSPGMARFDATPDAKRRDRIDGIHISAVNGQEVDDSELDIKPGRTKVRVGFDWPQGGDQEVDLDFDARPDKTYVVYYDVYPPYMNRLQQSGSFDDAAGAMLGAAGGMGEGAILMLPPFAAAATGALAVRVGNEIAEDWKPADYVDVMVVAQHSPQGVACTRRVYPDGRVENR